MGARQAAREPAEQAQHPVYLLLVMDTAREYGKHGKNGAANLEQLVTYRKETEAVFHSEHPLRPK